MMRIKRVGHVSIFLLLAFCSITVAQRMNECELGSHDCPEHSKCIDKSLGYTCSCKRGFEEKTIDGAMGCVDVDECRRDEGICTTSSHCVNSVGSFQCECDEGFDRPDYGLPCEDVNECELGLHNCHPHAKCRNIPGRFKCKCEYPLLGNGTHCIESDCVGWHQTGGCRRGGPPEPDRNEDCDTVIENGRSGYCECEMGRKAGMSDCYHFPFTCREMCLEEASNARRSPDCLRFRRTADCDPNGPLVVGGDRTCSESIPGGVSGFCECEGGLLVSRVGCAHSPFVCDHACKAHVFNVTLADPDYDVFEGRDSVELADIGEDALRAKSKELHDPDAALKKIREQVAELEAEMRNFMDAAHALAVIRNKQSSLVGDLIEKHEALLPNETFAKMLHNVKRIEDDINVLGLQLVQEGGFGGHLGLDLDDADPEVSGAAQKLVSVSRRMYDLTLLLRLTNLDTPNIVSHTLTVMDDLLDIDLKELRRGGRFMVQSESRVGRCMTRDVFREMKDLEEKQFDLIYAGCYHQMNSSLAETQVALTTPERIVSETFARQWWLLPSRSSRGDPSWTIKEDKPPAVWGEDKTQDDGGEKSGAGGSGDSGSEGTDEDNEGGHGTEDPNEAARSAKKSGVAALMEMRSDELLSLPRSVVREHLQGVRRWREKFQRILERAEAREERCLSYHIDWGRNMLVPCRQDLYLKERFLGDWQTDRAKWRVLSATGGGGSWKIRRVPKKKKGTTKVFVDVPHCLSNVDPTVLAKCELESRTMLFATPVHDEFLLVGRFKEKPPSVEAVDEEDGFDLGIDLVVGDRGVEDDEASSSSDESAGWHFVDVYFLCDETTQGHAWWSSLDEVLYLCDGDAWVHGNEENLELSSLVDGELQHVLRSDMAVSFADSLQDKSEKFPKLTTWQECRYRPEDYYFASLAGAGEEEGRGMTRMERIEDLHVRIDYVWRQYNTLMESVEEVTNIATRVNELSSDLMMRVDEMANRQYKIRGMLRSLSASLSDFEVAQAIKVRGDYERSPLPRQSFLAADVIPADSDVIQMPQEESMRMLSLQLYVLMMQYEAEKIRRITHLTVKVNTKRVHECSASFDSGTFLIRHGSPDGPCLRSIYTPTEGPGKGVDISECERTEDGTWSGQSSWFLRASGGSKFLLQPAEDWSRCLISFTRTYRTGMYPCAWGKKKWKDIENTQGQWIMKYTNETHSWRLINRWHQMCLNGEHAIEPCDAASSNQQFYITPIEYEKMRVGIAPPLQMITEEMYRPRNLSHPMLPPPEMSEAERVEQSAYPVDQLLDEIIEVPEEVAAELSEEERERARAEGSELSLPYTYDDDDYVEDEIWDEASDIEAEGVLWAEIKCSEQNEGVFWWSRLHSWLFECKEGWWFPAANYMFG
eukprot:Rmarinus@m.2043